MPKGLKGFQKGELNPEWKGDDVGYIAIHEWVYRHLKKPDKCSKCGRKERLDLANKSQKYLRDILDWEWLCRACHMTKDGRRAKLIKRNKTQPHKVTMYSEFPEMIKLFQDIASQRKRDLKGRFIMK